jgi:hypothetical protein
MRKKERLGGAQVAHGAFDAKGAAVMPAECVHHLDQSIRRDDIKENNQDRL